MKQAWGGAQKSAPWTTAAKPQPYFEKGGGKFIALSTSELKKQHNSMFILIWFSISVTCNDLMADLGTHRICSWDKKTATEKCNCECATIRGCSVRCQPKSPAIQGGALWRVPGPRTGTGTTERDTDLAKIWQYWVPSSYLKLIRYEHIPLAATPISNPHLRVTNTECSGGLPNRHTALAFLTYKSRGKGILFQGL